MYTNYYVNRNQQQNGDHEVHKDGCYWLPLPHNRIHLGAYASCRLAVLEAKRHFKRANGCKHCSSACHTS